MDSASISIRRQIVGTWILLDYRTSDEPPEFPLGQDARGNLIFTPDGFMAAHLLRPGARPFEHQQFHDGIDSELANAMRHSLAYSGRYQIIKLDGNENTAFLRTHVSVATIPNWVDSVQEREVISMEDDCLVLCALVFPPGQVCIL